MSFFKKLGRAIDPTSSKSPLGGIVRMGIGAIPGGTAALEGIKTVGSSVRLGSPAPAPNPNGPAPTAANAVPAMPGAAPLDDHQKRQAMMMVGGVAALLVVVYLFARK